MGYQQDYYLKLRDQGLDEDAAFKETLAWIQSNAAGPPVDEANLRQQELQKKYSPALSAATGGSDPIGWTDEAMGALDAVYPSQPFGQQPMGTDEYFNQAGQRRTDMIKGQREISNEARTAHPVWYAGGQIGTGAALGAGGPLPKSAGQAAAYSGLAGGVMAAGESEADNLGELAIDTGIGVGTGALFGLGGYGIAKGVGKAYNRLFKDKETAAINNMKPDARALAENVNKDAKSQFGFDRTVAEEHAGASAMDDYASQRLNEKYQSTPAQSTGNRILAEAQDAAKYYPEEHQQQLENAYKQMQLTEDFVNMHINDVAADPSKLGRADVGQQIADTIKEHVDSLVANRHAIGQQLFGDIVPFIGDYSVIEIPNTKAALETLIDQGDRALASPEAKTLANKLLSTLQRIEKDPRSMGRIKITELQSALSDWGDAAAGTGDLFKDIQSMKDTKAYRDVFHALLQDMDVNVQRSDLSKEAVSRLAFARDAYKEMSEEIDRFGTDAVKRIFKAEGADAADTITMRLTKARSTEEISGVMRLLDEVSPDTAKQVRAQYLEDLFTEAGKPVQGSNLSATSGTRMDSSKALSLLQKRAPQMEAIFGGDTNAYLQLETMQDLIRRVGGKIDAGARPQASSLLESATRVGGGYKGWWSAKLIRSILHNEHNFVKVVSSPEGVEAFNMAMQGMLENEMSDDAARALVAAFTRAGLDTAQLLQAEKPMKEPVPEPMRRGSE